MVVNQLSAPSRSGSCVVLYTTMKPSVPRKQADTTVRDRSFPGVSQIWSLIRLPSSSIVRTLCSAAAQGVPRQRQACFPYRAVGLSKDRAVRRTKSTPLVIVQAICPTGIASCAARTRASAPESSSAPGPATFHGGKSAPQSAREAKSCQHNYDRPTRFWHSSQRANDFG